MDLETQTQNREQDQTQESCLSGFELLIFEKKTPPDQKGKGQLWIPVFAEEARLPSLKAIRKKNSFPTVSRIDDQKRCENRAQSQDRIEKLKDEKEEVFFCPREKYATV